MLQIKAQRERRIGSVHALLSSTACSAVLGCSHGELFTIILNDVAMGRRRRKAAVELYVDVKLAFPGCGNYRRVWSNKS